jgi:hypothetical protein
MSEQKILKVDGLREDIRESVKTFGEKLAQDIGDNLQSLSVVGSSLTGDFRPGKSDINTVLVVHEQNVDLLNILAGLGKAMGRKRIKAPILMTPDYIEQSRDVFGIEFLDFQLIHNTIYGPDPFEEMTFEKQHIRLQCERELKATLIRLRQGYIAAVNQAKMIRLLLISTAGALVPILRAMLWLKDLERPRESKGVFDSSAEAFSIEPEILIKTRQWRDQKSRTEKDQIINAFGSIYKTVEKLADFVDKLEV